MKRIAALTMVRNDDYFLDKWTSYYGGLLGRDNLFIYFDGSDQAVPAFAAECHTEVIERVAGNVRESDKGRIDILSAKAAELLQSYDMVIGTDVDEFLIVDPKLGVSLPDFLSSQDIKGHNSLSGLGCDVIQNVDVEPALDTERPILSQRVFARLSTRYTKTSVLCRPVQWGSGFHRTRKGNYHIVPDLYLFHFGCADAIGLEQKIKDEDLSSRGWNRHLLKRRNLIETLPQLPVRDWDKWTVKALRIQSAVHLPYTWNKPAMFNLRIIVRLPERFTGIV